MTRPVDLGTVVLGRAEPLAPTEEVEVPLGSDGWDGAPGWRGELPDGDLVADRVVLERAGRAILGGVTSRARPGRPLALTGPSGSGKSSLLSVLGGLVEPDAGAVTLEGEPVVPGELASRRRIGLVLQGYGLVSLLTARENVEIAIRAQGFPYAETADRATEALRWVGLIGRGEHLVEELSGGQQQRVALARALATQPPVLLADEPTAELDHETRDAILGLLLSYGRGGRILVIATHDPDVAALCDDRLRLVDGAVAD